MKYILILCLLLLSFGRANTQEQELQSITAENASQLEQVARLGRGTAHDLEWNPAGTLLAVGSATGVWLLNEQLEEISQMPITQEVTDLAWSLDGAHLAVTSSTTYSCSTQIWTSDFKEQRFRSISCGNSVKWSADNRHLAVFNTTPDTNVVQLIDLVTSTVITLPGQDGAWSASGNVLFTRLLTTRSYTGTPTLYSWDASTGEQLFALEIATEQGFPILWGQDDKTLILRCGETVDEGVIIRLCSLDTQDGTFQPLNEIERFSIYSTCVCVFDLQASYDHNLFAYIGNIPSAGYLNIILVVDNAGNDPSYVGYGERFTWKPETRHLTAIVGNGVVRTYDAETGAVFAESHAFTPPINMISIRPATSEIASAAFGYDQPTVLWDFQQDPLTPIREFTLEFSEIAQFTPDGSMFVAGGMVAGETAVNQAVVGLNPDNGERLKEVAGFYAQGEMPPERYWNADYSEYVEVIDQHAVSLPNGYIIQSLSSSIEFVSWSPDGSMVATVERHQQDYTFDIRTWRVADGSLINRYASGMFAFRGLVWSPTGQQIAVMLEHPTGTDTYVRGLRVFSVRPNQTYAFDQNDFEVFQDVNVELIDQQAMAVWNSDGTLLAVGLPGTVNALQIYQLDEAVLLVSLPTTTLTDIEWSADDRFIAAGSDDGTIWLWGVPFPE